MAEFYDHTRASDFGHTYWAHFPPEYRQLDGMPYTNADLPARFTFAITHGDKYDFDPLIVGGMGPYLAMMCRIWDGKQAFVAMNGNMVKVTVNPADFPAWVDPSAPLPPPIDDSVVKWPSGGIDWESGKELWWSGNRGDDEFGHGETYEDVRGKFRKIVRGTFAKQQAHLWVKL